MTSWRSTTPQPVQDDFDALLTLALGRAEELLKEHREFFPFGTTMSDEGPEGLASADPGTGEQPESQLVLDLLYEGAAHLTGDLAGSAMVTAAVAYPPAIKTP